MIVRFYLSVQTKTIYIMNTNKTKRRRINVRTIEEKMSDKLMEIHVCSPKEAWKMVKFKAMQRELKAIG